MANEQNLVKGGAAHKLTAEEASRGGKASVETRRRRKSMAEAFEVLLSMGVDESGQTGVEALTASMFNKAMDGDVKAFTEIRDTCGEMPVQRVEVSTISDETYERVAKLLEED